MKGCVCVWLKNTRKWICQEGRQGLKVRLVAVTRCAQRYELRLVVATVAQGSGVVQLQNVVVRVPKVATLGASVLVFSKDVFFCGSWRSLGAVCSLLMPL